jgi:hypothetical protein
VLFRSAARPPPLPALRVAPKAHAALPARTLAAGAGAAMPRAATDWLAGGFGTSYKRARTG